MSNFEFKQSLEARFMSFSKKVASLVRDLQFNIINKEYTSQLIRSASSIGANYIEANEAESRKDFFHRIKIARKEARETKYWLELVSNSNTDQTQRVNLLQDELIQIIRILSAILNSQFNKLSNPLPTANPQTAN